MFNWLILLPDLGDLQLAPQHLLLLLLQVALSLGQGRLQLQLLQDLHLPVQHYHVAQVRLGLALPLLQLPELSIQLVEELLRLLVEKVDHQVDHLLALGRVHLAYISGLVGELLLAHSIITLGGVVLQVPRLQQFPQSWETGSRQSFHSCQPLWSVL